MGQELFKEQNGATLFLLRENISGLDSLPIFFLATKCQKRPRTPDQTPRLMSNKVDEHKRCRRKNDREKVGVRGKSAAQPTTPGDRDTPVIVAPHLPEVASISHRKRILF
ncbi:hypothetical protein J6590_001646 [Homalodisca vitripennis]|nr:hypothetical protein J6590_001646 [Homalodisca vitripennis]